MVPLLREKKSKEGGEVHRSIAAMKEEAAVKAEVFAAAAARAAAAAPPFLATTAGASAFFATAAAAFAAPQVLRCNAALLEAIQHNDWQEYQHYCCPSISCVEPETKGQVVEGLAFHKFFFDQAPEPVAKNTTLASPHVRLIGHSCAVVTGSRIVQSKSGISCSQETRIWQLGDDRQWRNVHFHRSSL